MVRIRRVHRVYAGRDQPRGQTLFPDTLVQQRPEQQRIGFARVLASNTTTVFLDEATSAVDTATERVLYEALHSAGLTIVSVGHRSSLMAYHTVVLELQGQGRWRLLTREQAKAVSA